MKRRIRCVKKGDVIKKRVLDGRSYDGGAETYQYRIELWTVKKIYPFHVLSERNGIRECFDLGWLIMHGYER